MDALADPYLHRPVQDQDVVQGYRFFFGRDPESADAVASRRGATRGELLRELVGSAEYAQRVGQPVLEGQVPLGDQFSDRPAASTLAWAASFLPLEDAARARLSRAPNWVAAHATALGDARMRAAAQELKAELPLDALAARLEALSADMGRRAIVGEVEEATAAMVRGYVLDRNAATDVLGVELWIDGRFAAAARADAYDRDLQERFGGSGRYGFVFEGFTLPAGDEERALRLEVRESGSKLRLGSRDVAWRPARAGHDLAALAVALREAKATLSGIEQALKLASGSLGMTPDRWDAYWRAYYIRTPALAVQETREAAAFAWRPRFDVVVAGGALDPLGLAASRESLEAQVFGDYTLHEAMDPREAPSLEGDYAVLLNAGDTLAHDALHRLAAAVQSEPRPVLVSMDSDAVTAGEHRDPVLRPAFDYDLLLQAPYLGPTAAVEVPALRAALEGGGDLSSSRRLDLWLRVTEAADAARLAHVPRVLHHGRANPPSSPPGAHAKAVREHLQRIGSNAVVREAPCGLSGEANEPATAPPRVSWPLERGLRAAVIVPTRDRLDLLGPCLASLETSRTLNQVEIEVVVVDNNSAEAATRRTLDALELSGRVRVLGFSDAFNWSAINNFAARQIEADVLVFLNNDTVVLTPDWCDALCGQAMREEVGAVGARLLYEDGSIQHAGIVLGTAQALAAHEGVGAPAAEGGYLGRRNMTHRAAAVTGACLATRREVFMRLGGFDEAQLAIEANDIDFCLRVRHAGLAVLYEPAATLYHFESRSRGHTGFDAEKRRKADAELAVLKARWGEAANHDPFYNPHFDRMSRPFTRLGAPPEL